MRHVVFDYGFVPFIGIGQLLHQGGHRKARRNDAIRGDDRAPFAHEALDDGSADHT
jgi:hypothetical protein